MMRALLVFVLGLLGPSLVWSQTATTDKKVEGDAALLTNYVWHGLTQTKRNPAIQTSIYYNMAPSLKFGMWGSNVSYYSRSKSNVTLRLIADIDFNISQNFAMGLHYSDNRYFESDDRDGNTLGLDFTSYGYNVLIENESNWQGTVTKARYYVVKKTWDVFTSWKWENQIGYTTFNTLNHNNYGDFRTGIGTSSGLVFWQAALTFTDNNSAFDPFTDYFIILSARARF